MNKVLFALLLFAAPVAAQSTEQRFEAGGLFTGTFLRRIGTRDAGIGTDAAGLGGRLVYHVLPYLDLETDIIVLPGNSATSGNHLQGFFGAKAGRRFEKLGLFAKARPGFIHFWRDPFGVTQPGPATAFFSTSRASSTEPSIDIGGVVEYYTARHLIVRLDAGDTIIRYASRLVQVSPALPPMQAGGFTTHNVQISIGVGFRFSF